MNGKNILIVEDEQSLLDVLSDRFQTEGFTVFKAKNGVEGLEIAQSNRIDLVLLDIVMPKMDGLTLLKKIRQDVSLKDIPVILLTNLTDPEKVSQALQDQAYDFLVKSDWKLEEVVAKVKDRLP